MLLLQLILNLRLNTSYFNNLAIIAVGKLSLCPFLIIELFSCQTYKLSLPTLTHWNCRIIYPAKDGSPYIIRNSIIFTCQQIKWNRNCCLSLPQKRIHLLYQDRNHQWSRAIHQTSVWNSDGGWCGKNQLYTKNIYIILIVLFLRYFKFMRASLI